MGSLDLGFISDKWEGTRQLGALAVGACRRRHRWTETQGERGIHKHWNRDQLLLS